MKKVFSNTDDVIHTFAQQSQHEGRNSSNSIYFIGTKIYSYGHHYLLGEFIDKDTIIINDNGYSATTGKHINSLRYATRQFKQFFTTETDLKLIKYGVDNNLKSLISARKPELYIEPIMVLWNKLHEYLEFTRTLTKAKKKAEYKHIAKIVKNINNDYDTYMSNLSEVKKQAKIDKDIRIAAEIEELLPKFYAHEVGTMRIGDEDFVRLSQDGDYIETTQGVKIPIKDAQILYALIKRGVDIKGHRISHYTVTSINGTLKIGCHNINMLSVHRTGKLL
jgi:hypothetical protein